MIFKYNAKRIYVLVGALSMLGFCLHDKVYYFSIDKPTIEILGIEPNGIYASNMQCSIKGLADYGQNSLSLMLDTKFILDKYVINKKDFEYNFVIPTRELSNGYHKITALFTKKNFNNSTIQDSINFIIDNKPLNAYMLKDSFDKAVFQGRVLHGSIVINKQPKSIIARALSKSYKCFAQRSQDSQAFLYNFAIPISCQQMPNEYPLSFEIIDYVGNKLLLETTFQVVIYPFKKQVLKAIIPERHAYAQDKEIKQDIKTCTEQSIQKKLWQGCFMSPVAIESKRNITTEFGAIRILPNGELEQHAAIDIAQMPRTIIKAPQTGILVLKKNYILSGNTLILDHGYGILTLLAHLDSFADIDVGQRVLKGTIIGTLGKTGCATGYHVHWQMFINKTPVDPLQLTETNL